MILDSGCRTGVPGLHGVGLQRAARPNAAGIPGFGFAKRGRLAPALAGCGDKSSAKSSGYATHYARFRRRDLQRCVFSLNRTSSGTPASVALNYQ